MSKDDSDYILVSNEKYWKRLCERGRMGKETHVFVRRGKVGPKEAQQLLFYVMHPLRQICGVADFIERLTGKPEDLWNLYGNESCLVNLDEYLEFLEGRPAATIIRFRELHELEKPIPIEAASKILGFASLPQGGMHVNKGATALLVT